MRARQTIHLDGIVHGAPIPMAARIGPLLMSSSIPGLLADTGSLAVGLEQQAKAAFTNAGEVLHRAGATWDHVIHITVSVRDWSDRAAVDSVWSQLFPDRDDRPARKSVLAAHFPPELFVQLDLVAYIPAT